MRNSVRLLLTDTSRGGRKFLVLMIMLLCVCTEVSAAVTVLLGTGGTGICSNKAVTGTSPAYTTLTPIIVTEGLNTDFAVGTNTLVLNAPAGWQFGSMPSLSYITGSNITGISGTISTTSLTVNITVASTSGADQFTITGLLVQPLTTSAPFGNIVASTVSGITGIAVGANFAPLSVTAPLNASVAISATPSGPICPGTNVVFTPTATNGGTPTFTWALNGVDVSIGSSFSSSTLANGHTVSCRMLSSLSCLTGNPVFSNTLTTTVLAAPAAISGLSNVCPGNTIAQSNTTGGGIWSSTNTAVGSINSSGVVTGLTAGTTTISYTVGGCASTKTVFVNNHPFAPALSPTSAAMCNATTMSVTATGTATPPNILSQNFNSGLGAWTVDTTGSVSIVNGAQWKACADSYLNEQGWYRSPDHSTFIMANADTSGSSSTLSTRLTSPMFSLAEYTSATLSFQHAYDYWPAGDVYVNLEISTNGGASWTTITNFKGANVGSKMAFVSQSYSLNAYLGYPNVKVRFYYHSNFGYYWAIDNIVITGTPGVVTPTWLPTTYLFNDAAHTIPYTGGAASTVYVYPTGVATPTPITYTATATNGSCAGSSTAIITVNPSPGAVSGGLNVCVGTTTTLGNTALGGSWVSGNTSIATVGSGSGIVTGVAPGTATVTYLLSSSCMATAVITVNITPAPITGNQNVCLGYTSVLADATTGGAWTSDNTAVAPVNMTTGEVHGLALGTANITYSLGTGCEVMKMVTVQPLPAPVTGPSVMCASETITLNNTSSGGTWVSGSGAIATVGPTTGIVTGVSGGSVDVSYILTSTGCFTLKNVTVNPKEPITGPASICVGYNATLLNAVPGGNWTSGNTTVATIHATSGYTSALVVGTTDITYALPTGCVSYRVLTVDPIPADISGPTSVCIGSNITLTNTTPGGSWSSSNNSIASVGSSTGIVTGNLTGTALISYTISTGCYKTVVVTVMPVPAAITGTAVVCEGSTTILSCATGGGTWSSSNANATVAAGTVSGVSAGTVTITYTIPNTCFATRNVTVNPLPSAITGPLAVCQLQNGTLSSLPTGGSWTSSNTVVAVVGSSSGIITGGAAGTSNITYTLPTGCITTAVATVNTLPGGLTGPTSVCTGASVTLTSTSPGGGWTSSNALASVTGGTVSGVNPGTVNITYTLPTSCFTVKAMTVNASPAAITGVTNVCEGLSTLLASTTGGGGWTSGNTAIASVHPATGLVSGVSAGTTNITYMVVTGCTAVTSVNVMPVPATISGNTNVCPGTSSELTSASGGGLWSSANTAIVSAGSSSGVITGGTPGTTTITYILPTGCFTTATAVTNPLPSDISGAATICVDASTIYTDVTPGGTWSSSNTAIATAGSASGVITGVAAGVAVISYTLPTGCAAVKTISVNALPSAIAGPDNICQGATHSMSSTPTGGLWSSSMPAVGTIGLLSGDLYGVAGGITTISYTLVSGCRITKQVTVTPLPVAITGSSNVCVGASIALNDATPGGSWSSGNTAVGTISPGGMFVGIAQGTSIVTYALPLGCAVTKLISVNPLPANITGNTSLCIGVPSTLSSATLGGIWTSANPTIASVIPSSGIVSGFVLNTTTISYTLPSGCYKTAMVTVNFTPAAISGASAICELATTLLTDPSLGGSWSSSNSTVATVGSSTGIVAGVSAGTATISYTVFTGCYAIKAVTVNPLPNNVTGPSGVCAGYSIVMSNTTGGGTWSSSNTSAATVGSSTGSVFGVSAGTANISYVLPTGCSAYAMVTVHALPSAISGPSSVCLGANIALSTSTPGGTWTSSNPTVASVTSGIVSGLTLGSATITYTLGAGCFITKSITVNPLPPPIAGSVPTCPGVSIALTNSAGTGAWSSTTAPGVATVGTFTGIVSPLTAGTATITYTLPTGCRAYAVVTVNAIAPITGPDAICMGVPANYLHSTPGGSWTSGNTLIAGIGATSGLAVGFSANTVTLSYTLPGGCVAAKTVTVNPAPAAITGATSICPGFTTAFSSSPTGGTWSSSNVSLATIVPTTGVATGVAAGITTISYVLPTGCFATKLLTVNAIPVPITGSASLCTATTTTLTIATTGGTWSSSATGVATINPTTGVLGGMGVGTATISYTPASGCASTFIVTVYAMPGTITGTGLICNGSSTTFTNPTGGGSWSSSNTAIATIDGIGMMTGINPGTAAISYTTAGGCSATRNVTINIMPTDIAGIPSVCVGYTTLLSSTPSGGTWTSGSTGIATVPAGAGMVSGITAGTSTVTYRLSTGCRVTAVVTVSAAPGTIAGTTQVCEGSTTILTDPLMGGGTWSSSSGAIATIGSLTGVATGVAQGTATITYMIGAGCVSTATVTVNPIPLPITGSASACIGMTTTLNTTTTGGTWSSSGLTVATVDGSSGVVNGVGVGTSIIYYTLATGCRAERTVTVNPIPGTITGADAVCVNSAITLGNSVPGGAWSSSDILVGTVNATTGAVTGIAAGTVYITYTLGAGCMAVKEVTVNPLPGTILGALSVCNGQITTLSNAAAGGTWSVSAGGVASIASSGGTLTGSMAGTTQVTYTLPTGCATNATVTVHPFANNTGGTIACVGFTTALSNSVSGGAWSSGNTTVATVGGSTGIVMGVAPGTATISYLLPTGCLATSIVTVTAVSSVTGSTTVCRGLTTVLGNPAAGGVWSTSNASIATVGATTGILTGVNAGTANISYTYGPGCVSVVVATVHPLSGITGSGNVCAGQTITLSNSVAGGTWSTTSSFASVDASAGTVTGLSGGTATVSYTLPTGCTATKVITINPLSPILGASSICLGGLTTLTNLVAGGTWSSSNTGVASINTTTGVVNGNMVGTSTVSYHLSTGCNSSFTVTVQPLPAAISGANSVCEGATTILNNTTPGGTWSSSNSNAAIGSITGIVSGVSAGPSTISYILNTGCYKTTTITVNALPPAILGAAQVCVGAVTTLVNSVPGGTWTSGSTSIANIHPSLGTLSGVAQGTSSITYTLPTTCSTTLEVTVNPLPDNIIGSASICAGASVTFGSSTVGGTWSSANATVSVSAATGSVMGVSPGSATITYTLPTGCYRTQTVNIFAPPSVITGPTDVCVAATIQLFNTTTGGSWATSNASVATIGPTSGVVTGISAGTALISYSQATGCSALYLITVNPLPAALTGTTAICVGNTSPFVSATAGGGWSSSATGIASVNATGIVTGISAGNAIITYTLPTGCRITEGVTVNPLPAIITGAYAVCANSVTHLANTSAGGTWSSSNTAIATVTSTGAVSGIVPGTANISYILGTGCAKAVTVTVNQTPVSITGPSEVCKGANITLANTTPSGVWSSGTPAVATITSAGVVSGVNAGTSLVSYTLSSTGCKATLTVTVNPLPGPIGGIVPLCPGTSITLSNSISGGTWATSSPAVVVDMASGLTTGMLQGFAVVTYTLPTGCTTAGTLLVNPLPAAITGAAVVCENGATTLSNTSPGGAWISGTASIAIVNTSTGAVTGIMAGNAPISYVLPTGCMRSVDVTVNPLPANITGATSACLGASMNLVNSSPGGTWTSGNIAVATVGATSGIVNGIALGTARVTYTLSTGCSRNTVVTVNPLPLPVTGTMLICQGNTTTLSSGTAGGNWSSSNMGVATIAGTGGVILGTGGGTSVISYTLPTGCSTTSILTVNALLPIAGVNSFCAGDTSVYMNAVPGGTWSNSTTTVATINPMGTLTGIAGGVTLISYTLPSGCVATRAITINSLPVAFYVTGGGTFCIGSPAPPIGLTGSVPGFEYRLYQGAALINTMTGSGAALNYGVYSVAGTYSVQAVNPATGCLRPMSGTAVVDPVAIAPASVSIFNPAGDTVCNGTPMVFMAVPVMGGSSPTYQWKVNSTIVGGSATYSYTPTDGDTVRCLLISSSPCAIPNIANSSRTITVLPTIYPDISISATPAGKVCVATPVSFTSTTTHGGTAPAYTWRVNGLFTHTGPTYTYMPADNDIVRCILTSDARCRNTDSAGSNEIVMDVTPAVIPVVTVSANPGFNVTPGTTITFSAAATNTGASPIYQWRINGAAITGATNATFNWGTFAGGEMVSCDVTSSGECGGYTSADTGIVTFNTAITTNTALGQMAVYPNPNNGQFVLKGKIPAGARNHVNIRVTNVIGQEILSKVVIATNGVVNERLEVMNDYANGMYMLTAQTDDGTQYVFHFVIER